MAWYQRAKEKARIRELESELEELTQRYAELVNMLGEVLAKLHEGAVEEASDSLRTEYEYRRAELKDQPNHEQ
ncbi:MAG: hypothetical protein ACE5IJ_11535 [Thermoplasmata archaeon]